MRAEHVNNNQKLKYSVKITAEGRKLSNPTTIPTWTRNRVDVTDVDTSLERMNCIGVLRIRVKSDTKSQMTAFRPTLSANVRTNKPPNSQSLLPNSMYFVTNRLTIEESTGKQLMMATVMMSKAMSCKKGPLTHCTIAIG